MSSHQERNLHEVTVLEIQTFQSLGKPEASQQQEGVPREIPLAYPSATELNEGILIEGEPAELFDVVIEDGIGAVAPVSTTWSETELKLEQRPESSRAPARKRHNPASSQIDEIVELYEQEYNQAPSRKKHHLSAANAKETNEVVFRLFMSERAPEEYILEKYEVETGRVKRFCLLGCGEHGQWNVRVSKYSGREHAARPVEQDPCPAIFYEKYKLELQDRLRGWSAERRARGSGMKDKFYYHMGKQFRSLVEVGKYILYSYKQKDLKQLRPERLEDVQEADAVEAITEMSSEPGNGSSENLTVDTPTKEIEIPTVSDAAEATPDNGSTEGLKMDSQPKEIGISTFANSPEVTVALSCTEDLKMDSPPKEIEIPTVAVEPQMESRDHDMVEDRNPSPQQPVSCEEKLVPDTDHDHKPKEDERKALEAVDPPEEREGKPDENKDVNIQSPYRAAEEDDDIFSDLPEIENLDLFKGL